jgi:hypothetical protein
VEINIAVTSWSTIRVLHSTYSVPSRLIGETVRVRVWDDGLEVVYAQKMDLSILALSGAKATVSTTGTSSGRWCSSQARSRPIATGGTSSPV